MVKGRLSLASVLVLAQLLGIHSEVDIIVCLSPNPEP